MTLLRKVDEAPSHEGPVVLYIKERIWYCLPQEQVVLVVYVRAIDIQEIARMVGLPGPSQQREWLRPWAHFYLAQCLQLPRALELLQPDCSSHLHAAVHQDHDIVTLQERAPGGKACLETAEFLELLVRQLRLGTLLCQERKVQFVTCLSSNQLLIQTTTQMSRPDISPVS